jgi:hypothetical protein
MPLSAAVMAEEAETYAIQTKLGWMAAGMTGHITKDDVKRSDVLTAIQRQREIMVTRLRGMQNQE